MSNYYFLSWKQSPEGSVAYHLGETRLTHELIAELHGKQKLPFDFELKKVTEGKKELIISDDLDGLQEIWDDYQPNSLALPLMSERMKNIIQSNLTGHEEIDWISCIIHAKKKTRTYYILRFNKLPDVLDIPSTIFVPGTDSIIKRVFAIDKVRKHNIFVGAVAKEGDLWRITTGIYVSEALKKAIQKSSLSGIAFSRVPVA